MSSASSQSPGRAKKMMMSLKGTEARQETACLLGITWRHLVTCSNPFLQVFRPLTPSKAEYVLFSK